MGQNNALTISAFPANALQYLEAMLATNGPLGFIQLAVDASGSMASAAKSVIELRQEVVSTMKAEADMARRSFGVLSSFCHEETIDVPPTRIVDIQTPNEYVAHAGTALYMAVYNRLDLTFRFQDAIRAYCAAHGLPMRELRCGLHVITDGEDTSSADRHADVKRHAAEAIRRGVILTGHAVGMSAERLEELLGFPPGSFKHVPHSAAGFRQATRDVSHTVTGTMTGKFQPHAAAPAPIAPISPSGTVRGDVVDPDEFPTEPVPGKK